MDFGKASETFSQPQLVNVALTFSDSTTENDTITSINVKFSVLSSNQKDEYIYLSSGGLQYFGQFQLMIQSRWARKLENSPIDEPNCNSSVTLIGNGGGSSQTTTGISSAIAVEKSGDYFLKTYEYRNTFKNANLCSGEYYFWRYDISDNRGPGYSYRYWANNSSFFYSKSWDENPASAPCPRRTETFTSSNLLLYKYDLCLRTPSSDQPIGNYDKFTSRTAASAAPSPTPSPTSINSDTKDKAPYLKPQSTIICVKGKLLKKVTGVKPTCPAGYKKK